MCDGIPDDVGRMNVCQLVDNLATSAARSDQPASPKHAQVLADQRLRCANRVDEFVDAIRVVR